MPKLLEVQANSFAELGEKGKDIAVLWDYRQDLLHVQKHYDVLHDLTRQLKYLAARKERLAWKRLKLYKNSLIRDFENNLQRIWDDKRTGTEFGDGYRFEPHHVTIQPNRVLWDGMGLFAELITGETSVFVSQMRAGIGVSDTTLDMPGLENEIAIANIIRDGDANADGNVIKWSAPFGTGVPSNNFSEFGASDKEGTILVFRVVIQQTENQLKHVQNVTFVQASHAIAQVSISDVVV